MTDARSDVDVPASDIRCQLIMPNQKTIVHLRYACGGTHFDQCALEVSEQTSVPSEIIQPRRASANAVSRRQSPGRRTHFVARRRREGRSTGGLRIQSSNNNVNNRNSFDIMDKPAVTFLPGIIGWHGPGRCAIQCFIDWELIWLERLLSCSSRTSTFARGLIA